jgi:hypothetical protein
LGEAGSPMTVVSCRREDGRPQAAAARRAGLEEVRKVCDDLSETGPNRCLKSAKRPVFRPAAPGRNRPTSSALARRDEPLLTAVDRQSVPPACPTASRMLRESALSCRLQCAGQSESTRSPARGAPGSSAQAIGRWGPSNIARLCRTPRPSFGYAATPTSPASPGSKPTGSGLTTGRCATSTLTSLAR